MGALTRPDDLFADLFRRFMPVAGMHFEPLGDIRIDLDETDKAYTLRAEVPGAKKEDIRIEVDGNRVSVSAQVHKEYEEKREGGRALMHETYNGSVSRTVTLAHDVDETTAAAKLEDGVLTLTLPKRAGERSRQVAIQ